jgi:hypothetical protein
MILYHVFFERFSITITRLFPIKTNDVIVLVLYDNSLGNASETVKLYLSSSVTVPFP